MAQPQTGHVASSCSLRRCSSHAMMHCMRMSAGNSNLLFGDSASLEVIFVIAAQFVGRLGAAPLLETDGTSNREQSVRANKPSNKQTTSRSSSMLMHTNLATHRMIAGRDARRTLCGFCRQSAGVHPMQEGLEVEVSLWSPPRVGTMTKSQDQQAVRIVFPPPLLDAFPTVACSSGPRASCHNGALR